MRRGLATLDSQPEVGRGRARESRIALTNSFHDVRVRAAHHRQSPGLAIVSLGPEIRYVHEWRGILHFDCVEWQLGEAAADTLDLLAEGRDKGMCRDGQSPLLMDGGDGVFRAHHRPDALADKEGQDVALPRRDFFAKYHLKAIAKLQLLRSQCPFDCVVVGNGNHLHPRSRGHVVEHGLHSRTTIGMAGVNMEVGPTTMTPEVQMRQAGAS